jgi:septal ring factor EnvC (AmiA/AmiB activator)
MNNEQLHQDIGGLKSEVKSLRREVTAMAAKLDSIGEYIAQQKGARKATVFISSGASAVVAALVGWAVVLWGPK